MTTVTTVTTVAARHALQLTTTPCATGLDGRPRLLRSDAECSCGEWRAAVLGSGDATRARLRGLYRSHTQQAQQTPAARRG